MSDIVGQGQSLQSDLQSKPSVEATVRAIWDTSMVWVKRLREMIRQAPWVNTCVFVLQTPECPRMHDAVAILFEIRCGRGGEAPDSSHWPVTYRLHRKAQMS